MPYVQIKPDGWDNWRGKDQLTARWHVIQCHARIRWCFDKCKGKYQIGDPISNHPPNWPAWFESKEDAMLFKLTWG